IPQMPVLLPPRPETSISPADVPAPSAPAPPLAPPPLPSAPPPPPDDEGDVPMLQHADVGSPPCCPEPHSVPLPADDEAVSLHAFADELLQMMGKVDERGRKALERLEKLLQRETQGQEPEAKPSLYELIKGKDAPVHTPRRRWSGVVRDAIIEGEWSPAVTAFPVIREENGETSYVKHEWKVLQQAKKTLQENGHKSETGRALITWLHTSENNVPADCSDLARFLLSPSQYLVWYREWERLAREEENRPRSADDPLAGLRADMITGSGLFTSVAEQVRYPFPLLDVVARTAMRAYDAVPDGTVAPSFTGVQQGLTEQYSHFIDRLHSAIMNSSQLPPENRETMFRLLAFENANQKTKAILATLPKTADVSDMLELTLRAEQGQQAKHIAGAVAAAMRPTTSLVAAAVQKMRPKSFPNTAESVCFR
ncbi:GAK9 protein, partial [Xiphorhynchus elegans]|nr:GAK9 protein [Xiphorhynchus elegans]